MVARFGLNCKSTVGRSAEKMRPAGCVCVRGIESKKEKKRRLEGRCYGDVNRPIKSLQMIRERGRGS